MLVNQTFLHKNWPRRYEYLLVNQDRTFFVIEEASVGKKYEEPVIFQMIDFVIDNNLLMAMSFIIRYIDQMCQPFPSGYALFPFPFASLFNHCFGLY